MPFLCYDEKVFGITAKLKIKRRVIEVKNLLKKCFVTVTLILFCFGIILPADAKKHEDTVGVADMQKVAKKSCKLKKLKYERSQRLKNLQTWVDDAKIAIAEQQNTEKREKMLQLYNIDFLRKKEFILNSFNKKLEPINESFLKVVEEQAKKSNCVLVFEKSAVLYGGKNITGRVGRNVE